MPIAGLIFFVVLNFCALSFSLYLAFKTGLRGSLLWVACLEIYFFLITVLLLTFGAVGLMKPIFIGILVVSAGLLVWAGENFRGQIKNVIVENSSGSIFSAALLSLICLGFLVILYDALFHPFFPHDPMTYELFFPARWLQSGGIELIPTPFGDNSRAYDAANACLYYFWLMMPLRNDMLAHCGEFFFVVFSVFSLVAISEEMGLKKPAKYLPALIFILIPLVIREAETAHTDFLLCSQVLAFLAFSLGHKRRAGRGLDLLALAALGGLAGSKYIALPSIILLVPIFATTLLRPFPKVKNILAWVAIFLLAGGFWYLRNIYVTGNPFYPLQVQLGSWVILPGAYTREVMAGWLFKTSGWGQTLAVMADGPRPQFQMILILYLSVATIFGFILSVKKSVANKFFMAYLALFPLLLHLTAAYLVPFHMDRFWLPAWAVATLSLAIIISVLPRSHVLIVISFFVLIAIEMMIEVISSSSGILSLFYPATKSPGIFLKLIPFALLSALIFRRIAVWKKVALWAGVFVVLCFWSQPGYYARRIKALEFNREAEFLERLSGARRIAYTGRNTPYPLMGAEFQNRVFYVNVNSRRDWQFHDYAKWFKQTYPGKMANTPEPAYYRMEQNFSDWWNNLVSAKVNLVAVCPVGVNELVNICHNRRGFPIEADWAEKHPESFKLIFEGQCRIYEISGRNHPQLSSAPGTDNFPCPLDALELIKSSPGTTAPEMLEKYFPYAMEQIRRNKLGPWSQ